MFRPNTNHKYWTSTDVYFTSTESGTGDCKSGHLKILGNSTRKMTTKPVVENHIKSRGGPVRSSVHIMRIPIKIIPFAPILPP